MNPRLPNWASVLFQTIYTLQHDGTVDDRHAQIPTCETVLRVLSAPETLRMFYRLDDDDELFTPASLVVHVKAEFESDDIMACVELDGEYYAVAP